MGRREARGFSQVELAVALALLAGVLYFLLDRLLYMQEMAEKTGVEETVRSINAGLRLEAASRLARGAGTRLPALEDENPIKWLSVPPRNYLGEHARPPLNAKPPYWYFQPEQRQLIYRPNNNAHLVVEAGEGKELRFAVRVTADGSNPVLRPRSPPLWFGAPVR